MSLPQTLVSGSNESEEIRIDHIGMDSKHAVRIAGVDLQRAVWAPILSGHEIECDRLGGSPFARSVTMRPEGPTQLKRRLFLGHRLWSSYPETYVH